jgi:acetyltransferase
MGPHYLDRMFAPRSIAVFGASSRADSVGTLVFRNLRRGGFEGPVYPINIRHAKVQGRRAYKTLADIGKPVDLAVVATPAATVPDIIHQCGQAGVHVVVILSAGFAEAGSAGKKRQQEIIDTARQYGIRIIGPNCLGVMRPQLGLNATFGHNMARPGQLALVSQSGALCTAMLDWAEGHGIGFSAMVSLGDAADVDFGDLLTYLALDPQTHSILLYIEGIRDARSFMSGLRIAARLKPIVVLKSGRNGEGSKAAVSHTAALVGSDDVFAAAIERAGAVRVYTIKQLFSVAQLLAGRNYRIQGQRLAVITNGGGPGVMATDRVAETVIQMAELSTGTLDKLNAFLPEHWSHANPVDILGDADAERYRQAVEAVLVDPNVDGVLVMLTPQAMTRALQSAQAVIDAVQHSHKPVLTCWMGDRQVAHARKLLIENHIAHFDTPEASVEAFAFLAHYRNSQQLLMQVPDPLGKRSEPDINGARLIIEEALAEGRRKLSDMETMAVLKAFNVPAVNIMEADTASQALVMAESLGFPVAMKINSPDITHKSDVSGVRLNISNAAAVRDVFRELVDDTRKQFPDIVIRGVTIENMYQQANSREIMIGVIHDPVFGPAISFGAGGTMVEIMQDRVIALPPINRFIAQGIIAASRVHRLLGDYRNMPPVNMRELENVLLRISELVCEVPHIREMDINPLIVDEQGVRVVDARMIVDYPSAILRQYGHMAVHPYPRQLVSQWQTADGRRVTIRPIRPEDARIEQDFIRRLSPQSKYFRFMQALHELTPDMLIRFTQIDYDREMALIGVYDADGEEQEVGVARYVTNPDGHSCEFAIVIQDEWHHQGLAFELMTRLMAVARNRGLEEMMGEVLANNREMLKLAEKLGFRIESCDDDPRLMEISLRL